MINVSLVGDQVIAARYKALGPQLRTRLADTIYALCIKLVGHIQQDKLQGQVLHHRSGRLQRSIHANPIRTEGTKIIGEVGTNVEYAAVHEYGLTVTVSEHLMLVKQAWGRPLKEPKEVTVRAHKATYPERSFLRSALKDMAPEIRHALTTAAESVMEGVT